MDFITKYKQLFYDKNIKVDFDISEKMIIELNQWYNDMINDTEFIHDDINKNYIALKKDRKKTIKEYTKVAKTDINFFPRIIEKYKKEKEEIIEINRNRSDKIFTNLYSNYENCISILETMILVLEFELNIYKIHNRHTDSFLMDCILFKTVLLSYFNRYFRLINKDIEKEYNEFKEFKKDNILNASVEEFEADEDLLDI